MYFCFDKNVKILLLIFFTDIQVNEKQKRNKTTKQYSSYPNTGTTQQVRQLTIGPDKVKTSRLPHKKEPQLN